MKLIEKKFKGVFEIALEPRLDHRGFFMRTYDEKIFNDLGIKYHWVQENHSRSIEKFTIRGLHFQFPPFSETKLVRAIRGKIMDVFLDLREDSTTFGQWGSIVLSEDQFNCILIPRGFAHGFCSLSNYTEIIYKVDNFYNPEYESGILWNDPDLNITWGVEHPIISEKDNKNMTIKDFITNYKYLKI